MIHNRLYQVCITYTSEYTVGKTIWVPKTSHPSNYEVVHYGLHGIFQIYELNMDNLSTYIETYDSYVLYSVMDMNKMLKSMLIYQKVKQKNSQV